MIFRIVMALVMGSQPGEPGGAAGARDAMTRRVEAIVDAGRPAGEDGWPELAAMCDAANAVLEAFEAEARADREAKGDWLTWATYRSSDYEPPAASVELSERAIGALDAAGVFARLEAVARFERFARPISLSRMGTPNPDNTLTYQGLRRLARLNTARMRLALDRRDFDEAKGAMRQSLALARAMFQQEGLIDQLIGESYARDVLELIGHELHRGRLAAEHCGSLLAVLKDAPEPAAFERLILVDRWQELHEVAFADPELRRNPDAFVEAEEDGLMQYGMRAWLGSFCMHEDETHFPSVWLVDRVARDAALAITLPPRTLAAWLWIDDRLPKRSDLAHARWSKIGLLARARGNMDAYVMRRDALRIMLALEVYYGEQDGYPETLDALVPVILPELPRDKFAPDGRYRYFREAPELPYQLETEYLLYSVGLDGVDNKGAADSGDSGVRLPSLFEFTRFHTLGFDYPFGARNAF